MLKDGKRKLGEAGEHFGAASVSFKRSSVTVAPLHNLIDSMCMLFFGVCVEGIV